MTSKYFFKHIRTLLAKEEIKAALIQLQEYLENSPKLDEVIQQAGRFADIRKQIRFGTVSHEDAILTTNQIRAGIIDLLTEIESTTSQTNFQKEAEQAISIVYKNSIRNSEITAEINIHIEDKINHQKAEKIYNIDHIDNANFS